MHQFEHKIRVRYVECDQMKFVHHSVYASYFEEARTEVLRNIGMIYSVMEQEGIIMPVRQMNIKYHYAARYDDVLKIVVRMKSIPVLKCELEYEVYNQKDELLTTAEMILFFAKKDTLRPLRLPKKYIQIMEEHLN